MIKRTDFILYIRGIIFNLLVIYAFLLWNCELSGVKIAIYIFFIYLRELFASSHISQVFSPSNIKHVEILKNFYEAILGR